MTESRITVKSSLESIWSSVWRSVVCVVSFGLVVAIGTSVLLAITNLSGYLPYSDRPGPGWQGLHWPTLEVLKVTVGFFVGWSPLLALTCIYYGVGLAIVGLLFGWLALPRWTTRTLGALLAGPAAAMAAAGAGWYIALGGIGQLFGFACGVAWGAFLFSHFVEPRYRRPLSWIRLAASFLLCAAFVYWIVSPTIPDADAQDLQVDVVRVVPGDAPLSNGNLRTLNEEKLNGATSVQFGAGLAEGDVKRLREMGITGQLIGGISSNASSGQATKRAHIVIVVTEPVETPIKFKIPKAMDVTYLERNGKWEMSPSNAPTLRKTIRLVPVASDKTKMKLVMDGQDEEHAQEFNWYPPMSSR